VTTTSTNESASDGDPLKDETSTADAGASRGRVCAVCTKEPVMKRDNEPSEKLEDVIAARGKMTLRERKALEREYYKNQAEKKKERGDDDDGGEKSNGESEDLSDGLSQSSNESYVGAESFDEEDDPLVQAVGGKEKLLTGDAYQSMLLEKSVETNT